MISTGVSPSGLRGAYRLADEIFRIQRLVAEELYEKGRVDAEDARCLADLRDYFMYATLRADREKAHELIKQLEECEERADKAKDRFHAGFFFTLAQLVSIRFEVARLPGEKVSYENWHRSFKETLRKLGIPAAKNGG